MKHCKTVFVAIVLVTTMSISVALAASYVLNNASMQWSIEGCCVVAKGSCVQSLLREGNSIKVNERLVQCKSFFLFDFHGIVIYTQKNDQTIG